MDFLARFDPVRLYAWAMWIEENVSMADNFAERLEELRARAKAEGLVGEDLPLADTYMVTPYGEAVALAVLLDAPMPEFVADLEMTLDEVLNPPEGILKTFRK